jgi:sirohydrochlorin cobaltochelatase
MRPAKALAAILSDCNRLGQIFIQQTNSGGFVLSHRDDENARDLETFRNADDALQIARYDDAGKFRPLRTAPNFRHGWRLELVDLEELRMALNHFYPGRLAVLTAWTENRLSTTSLRETLDRQSGMYRIAAKISDEQIDEVVGNFCKSDGGCLRTILWKRDASGTIPSTKLPPEKFDSGHDQTGRGENTIPLLCQEACNLLVAECPQGGQRRN